MTGPMQFGEYLKKRRTELGWTQPEAAAKAGIEQSYLSKLENGKSLPSEDVYQRLVEAFSLDTEALVAALYPAELDRLREIEDVRKLLLKRASDTRSATRRWLYAGVGALAAGGALAGLALVDRGDAATHYTYQSYGVLQPGESSDTFDDNPTRVDERTISIPEMRGPAYTETVPEGRRMWHLVGSNTVRAPARFRWAFVPGFALIIGGLGCFFVSWRRP